MARRKNNDASVDLLVNLFSGCVTAFVFIIVACFKGMIDCIGLIVKAIGSANATVKKAPTSQATNTTPDYNKIQRTWGLKNSEIKLVKEGKYKPENFEEPGEGEELDEEDYYFEDEKE